MMAVATALLASAAGASAASAVLARVSSLRPVDDVPVHSERGPIRFTMRRPSTSMQITPLALATWCDDLARALRHGSTLRSSLAGVLPVDAAIERHTEPLRHRIDRGASVTEACDHWSDALSAVDAPRIELVTTLSTVLAATASLGGSNAAPLDRFAATMRQRASDDLERGAQSAQAEMSARVLTLVPVVVLVLLLVSDAEVRSAISGSAGAAAVALGLALNVAGAAWMRRVIRPSGGA